MQSNGQSAALLTPWNKNDLNAAMLTRIKTGGKKKNSCNWWNFSCKPGTSGFNVSVNSKRYYPPTYHWIIGSQTGRSHPQDFARLSSETSDPGYHLPSNPGAQGIRPKFMLGGGGVEI